MQTALAQADNEQDLTAARLPELSGHAVCLPGDGFDDLIRLPVELLRDKPAVLERWQNKLRYLLIDEYQDTNTRQYQLVKLLTGERGMFTAVGRR